MFDIVSTADAGERVRETLPEEKAFPVICFEAVHCDDVKTAPPVRDAATRAAATVIRRRRRARSREATASIVASIRNSGYPDELFPLTVRAGYCVCQQIRQRRRPASRC